MYKIDCIKYNRPTQKCKKYTVIFKSVPYSELVNFLSSMSVVSMLVDHLLCWPSIVAVLVQHMVSADEVSRVVWIETSLMLYKHYYILLLVSIREVITLDDYMAGSSNLVQDKECIQWKYND